MKEEIDKKVFIFLNTFIKLVFNFGTSDNQQNFPGHIIETSCSVSYVGEWRHYFLNFELC